MKKSVSSKQVKSLDVPQKWGASLLCIAAIISFLSHANAAQPLDTNPASIPMLEISGTGAAPQSSVILSLSSKQNISARTSEDGNFTFEKIPYDFETPLSMNFTIPQIDQKKRALPSNTFTLSLRPDAFSVRIEGKSSKAASIALGASGNGSAVAVANAEGQYRLASNLYETIKPSQASIVASIINVSEECCPRAIVPHAPITVSLRGSSYSPRTTAINPNQNLSRSVQPTQQPGIPVLKAPPVSQPEEQPPEPLKDDPAAPIPKPLFTPFGRTGEFSYGESTRVVQIESTISAGGSIDSTWVEGLRKISTQLKATIMLEAVMIGGFIDAQSHLSAQLALQRLAAEAVNDYTPSEALCRFGSLSKGLASSEGRSQVTKRALNEALGDRETMRRMTAYGMSPGAGDFARVRQFRNIYCDTYDESNALATFCETTASSANFNKDVDFTRLLDVPLTLPVNFVTTPTAAQLRGNADVMAYANNLFAGEAFRGFRSDDFKKQGVMDDDVQNYRSVVAARSLVRNSFTSFVGMKAEGTTGSATYMQAIANGLGLSATDVTRLVGSNPSYFAQMEMLTKKIYQDPKFFVNLYEKPANVERQRAAMKGVSLQQQADLLDVLKRREMLLSVLLELRLKNLSEESAD